MLQVMALAGHLPFWHMSSTPSFWAMAGVMQTQGDTETTNQHPWASLKKADYPSLIALGFPQPRCGWLVLKYSQKGRLLSLLYWWITGRKLAQQGEELSLTPFSCEKCSDLCVRHHRTTQLWVWHPAEGLLWVYCSLLFQKRKWDMSLTTWLLTRLGYSSKIHLLRWFFLFVLFLIFIFIVRKQFHFYFLFSLKSRHRPLSSGQERSQTLEPSLSVEKHPCLWHWSSGEDHDDASVQDFLLLCSKFWIQISLSLHQLCMDTEI